ncbi:ABC transporter permease [Tepidibacter mesophilus]|uniref:ABC transporter permease n=1 Tax=Tepidibacter mesophilus TaxID=655607 RepID=UPI000C07CD4F|nr:hypothetical protein [Tepidibacter mesophilus]
MCEVIKFEIKRFIKNRLFFLMGFIIMMGIVISNPILDNQLWADNFAVSDFVNNMRMISIIFLPIAVAAMLKENKSEGLENLLFTQPISKISYAMGKYLTIVLLAFFWICCALIAYILMPLYFKSYPYDWVLFIKWTLVVVVPILLLYIAVLSYLYMKTNSVIIIFITSFFITLMSEKVPFTFDYIMKNKFFNQIYWSIDKDVYSILIMNRLFTLGVAALALMLYLREYVLEKVNKNSKNIISLASAKLSCWISNIFGNQFKMLTPHMIPILSIFVLSAFYSYITNDYTTWSFTKYSLQLLPAFFICHAISEVYENDREGILFTSSTPIFKQMKKRIKWGIMFSQITIFILFAIAIYIGLEIGWSKWIITSINSLFLSTIGLTMANLFKKSMAGYASVILYWGLCLVGGSKLAEKMWLISISMNTEIYYKTIWESLSVMSLISCILYILNIFYIGKKEKPYKDILISIPIGLIAVLVISLPWISDENKRTYAVFNQNQLTVIESNNYKLYYSREIPKETAIDTLKQWEFIQEKYKPYLNESKLKYTCVYAKEGTQTVNEDTLLLEYRYLKELNPPKFGFGDNYSKLTTIILNECGLNKVESPILEGWLEYMKYKVAIKDLYDIHSEEYLAKYYPDYLNPSYHKYFIEKIKQQDSSAYISSYILYYIEQNYSKDVIAQIFEDVGNSENNLNTDNLREIFLKYTNEDKTVNEKFDELTIKMNSGGFKYEIPLRKIY